MATESGSMTPLVAEPLDDGVLWAINRVLFHPRGYALAWHPDTRLFTIIGDGSEPWHFEGDIEDAKFAAFEDLLTRASRVNLPPT